MDEKSIPLFERVFGLVIAYLLPGLVVLSALASCLDAVAEWFTGAQNGPTLSAFGFVLLAALTCGMTITALRWVVFERVRFPRRGEPWRCLVGRPSPLDQAKRRDHAQTYERLRLDHYVHYLCYSNLAVAVVVAALTWWMGAAVRGAVPGALVTLVGLAAVTVIAACLGAAACDAVARYERRRADLLSLPAA